jgi:hypothetical protein
MAGAGLAFLGVVLFATAWMSQVALLPAVVVFVFLPFVLITLLGTGDATGARDGRKPGHLGRWVVLLAVVIGLFVAYLRMPALSHSPRWSGMAIGFAAMLRDYGREFDDYPQNARDLVRDVVPRKFAGGGWKITALSDGRLLVEGGRFRREVEYRYVSPDYFLLVWDK